MNTLEEHLEGFEEDFDKSLPERIGKLVVVGLASLFVSWIAEKQYDRVMDMRHERNTNVES